MILTIDAGNTRTKWGVFDAAGELKSYGVCLNSDLAGIDVPIAWRPCRRAVVSNVGGVSVAGALQAMLQALDIPIHWVQATAQACGVKNGYGNPQQLGTDRWAALIAAWQHYHKPCVVVNAGTALTVDALGMDDQLGIFLGGLILPGLNLMQHRLIEGTADIASRLDAESVAGLPDFPTNTQDAIRAGALTAMTGAVLGMLARLQRYEGQPPMCILSGGDAALLAEALSGHPEVASRLSIADNLILQGLLSIGRESA